MTSADLNISVEIERHGRAIHSMRVSVVPCEKGVGIISVSAYHPQVSAEHSTHLFPQVESPGFGPLDGTTLQAAVTVKGFIVLVCARAVTITTQRGSTPQLSPLHHLPPLAPSRLPSHAGTDTVCRTELGLLKLDDLIGCCGDSESENVRRLSSHDYRLQWVACP